MQNFPARAFFILCIFLALVSPAAAEPITRTVTMTWNASSSSAVVGYRLRYGTQSGIYTAVVEAGNNTWVQIPNLVDGTTYFFAVSGYTANGEETIPSDELVHTPNPAMFLNISTRALVGGGDDVMIAGFIIGGSSWKTVIVRALGPTLAGMGLSNALGNPVVELHGPEGLISANDSWRENHAAVFLDATGFAPAYDAEAATVVKLPPGSYTVIVRSADGNSGAALLEVYDGGIPVPQ